jgi:hypothetical protein
MSDDTGIVPIRGKQYKTVALRVDEFRKEHPDATISTEVVSITESVVVMKASILLDGTLISTGFAEEVRAASNINKTSALENAETSAVGRALAFYKYAGSEIASADEVANAINQQGTDNANAVAVMNELLNYDERLAILYFMEQDEEVQVAIHNSAPKNEKTAFKNRIKALEKGVHDWADEACAQVGHCLVNGDESGLFEILDEVHKKEKRYLWARLSQKERDEVAKATEARNNG